MLHLPGQVACYPILPLDTIGRSVTAYLGELQDLVVELLRDHELAGAPDPVHPGIRINGRRVAHLGVAVRDNITCFGLVLNADPDLALPRRPLRRRDCPDDVAPARGRRPRPAHRGAAAASSNSSPRASDSIASPSSTATPRHFPGRLHMLPLNVLESPFAPSERRGGRLRPGSGGPLPSDGNGAFMVLLEDLRSKPSARTRSARTARSAGRRTATFMILGNVCTRPCSFCSVPKGALSVEDDEPARVAEAAVRLGLKHVVITSVLATTCLTAARITTRCVAAIRSRMPAAAIGCSRPIFWNAAAIDRVTDSAPMSSTTTSRPCRDSIAAPAANTGGASIYSIG